MHIIKRNLNYNKIEKNWNQNLIDQFNNTYVKIDVNRVKNQYLIDQFKKMKNKYKEKKIKKEHQLPIIKD